MSFQWNIYEKSFTPYWASLAPKQFVHRHKVQKEACTAPRLFQDSRMKSIFRWMRNYILRNTKAYHFGIILCKVQLKLVAFAFDITNKGFWIRFYKARNHEQSLVVAQKREKDHQDWRRRTFPEEFEEEEEEVAEEEAQVGEEDDE